MSNLVDLFDTIDEMKMGFVLATNNATKVASQYVEKLARFGVTVPADQILTSSEATASYLRNHFPAGSRAFVVGEDGLESAMQAQGFRILDNDSFVGQDSRAEVVVVGMTRFACYKQLASAAYLINQGAKFVGTNPDVTFPTEIGPLPGAGSYIAFLQTATGMEPLVIGKPNQAMFAEALRRLESSPADTVMIGDRLNTDIAGAHLSGMRSILLLSGISQKEDLNGSPFQPTWIFNDLNELGAFLRAQNP